MRTWMMPLTVLALVCAGCSQDDSGEFQPYQAQPYGSNDTYSTLAALEPMDRPAPRRSTPPSPNWQPGKMRYDAVIPVERVAHLEPSAASSSSSEPVTYGANFDQSYDQSRSYDEPLNPSSGYSSGGGNIHTVAKGDTLYSLARRYYRSDSRWRDIYNANRNKINNPNTLPLGTRLVIP